MADIEVRLNTGDVNPIVVHTHQPEGRPVQLDVELTGWPARSILSGTPTDYRIIARELVEIADAAEPPIVASTDADYDEAEARVDARTAFKVGDRVRCIHGFEWTRSPYGPRIEVGDFRTVDAIDHLGVTLSCYSPSGEYECWNVTRFVLAEPAS
jgi:hypothetical protein